MYDVVRESESARRIAATGGVTRTDRDVRYEMSSPLSDFGHEQREVPVGDTRSVFVRMLESARVVSHSVFGLSVSFCAKFKPWPTDHERQNLASSSRVKLNTVEIF